MEKLCGAVGLSLALIYLVSFVIFWMGPADGQVHPAPYAAVTAVCAVLAVLARNDLARLWRAAAVRRTIYGYGALTAWTFVMAAAIRNYSGASWTSDWLEHFERSLYFLYRFPVSTGIMNHYSLAARPPLMNLVAAFFLAQAGDRFENFQVVFLLLNLLPFLVCSMLLPRLAGPRRARVLPLVVLFALNPVVMESATYTWTKAFAAFYVLLAVHFYLAGWKKGDPWRTTAAFVALSAGLLAHYSAGPYVVFFAVHYAAVIFRRRRNRWREVFVTAAVCGVLLATWFGWSLSKLGAEATFASNTSVTASRQYEGHNLEKIAANLWDTIVPAALREAELLEAFQQSNRLGRLRDYFFISYQTSLLLTMGLAGGLAAAWLYWRALRNRAQAREGRLFWAALVPFAILAGIASTGERDHFGLAHLTLLPVTLLGLTLVAGWMMSRKGLAVALLCGCAVDFGMGVWLHAHVEAIDNTASTTVFTGLEFRGAGAQIGVPGPDSLSAPAWTNWLEKHQYALSSQWLAAMDERARQDPAFAARARSVTAMLAGWKDDDARLWHGWFSRHGGSVTFLGDHVAGGAEWLLVAGMLALMVSMARELKRWQPQEIEVLARPATQMRNRRRAAGRR